MTTTTITITMPCHRSIVLFLLLLATIGDISIHTTWVGVVDATDTDYTRPPTILDTDYGSFIDDIFAVGLLLQSTDVLDPRLILTTAEDPARSARCVAKQIHRSSKSELLLPPYYDKSNVLSVAIGEALPPHAERGAVCGVPGKVGFALGDACDDSDDIDIDNDTDTDIDNDIDNDDAPPAPFPNGVAHAAELLKASDRTDWIYIAVGGQTSLQTLIRDHPDALLHIRTLVVMGGNWCTGFDAYPGVPTPTAETNISCDPSAANFVLDAAARARAKEVEEQVANANAKADANNGDDNDNDNAPPNAPPRRLFPDIHYVPLATVNVLSGDDYRLILDAASPTMPATDDSSSNINGNSSSEQTTTQTTTQTTIANPRYSPAARATIDLYHSWSASARADPNLLVHHEAMAFDPSSESTPQFDAVAVLVAMDLARSTRHYESESTSFEFEFPFRARVAHHEFANGVRFGAANNDAHNASNAQQQHHHHHRAAHSLWAGSEVALDDKLARGTPLSGRCRALTPHHFDDPAAASHSNSHSHSNSNSQRTTTTPPPAAVRAALGFVSEEAEREFFHEMALRISGGWPISSSLTSSASLPVTLSSALGGGAATAIAAAGEAPQALLVAPDPAPIAAAVVVVVATAS